MQGQATIDEIPWSTGARSHDRAQTQQKPSTPRPLRRAESLGVFSIALGLAELLAPDFVGTISGVGHGKGRRTVTRLMGAREIATGVMILTQKKPAPWVWARVVGDVVDLALLGRSFFLKGSSTVKLANAVAQVAAVTATDIQTARELSKPGQQTRRVVKTITMRGDPELVRTLWQRVGDELDGVTVSFRPATGGGATVVEAVIEDLAQGGMVGGLIARAQGKEAPMVVDRALRHFKQIVETGEVMHSDASIHVGMHPAQPSATPIITDDADLEVKP